MKFDRKKLGIAATVFIAGAAQAQSSVVLFGVADVTLSHVSQNGVSKTYMTQGGQSASRVGLRDLEDLGGGYFAGFWVEGNLNLDNGSVGDGKVLFNRRSTLDIAGPWGAFRMGREYMPDGWNHVVFDPFGLGSGVATGTNITGVFGANVLYTLPRASNSLSYIYGIAPNADSHGYGAHGLYAQATYAFPENVSGDPAFGRYVGGRIGYGTTNSNVAISYARSNGSLPFGPPTLVKYTAMNIGASYNFEVASVMAKMGVNDSDSPLNPKNTWWSIGAVVPAGRGYIPVSFNRVKSDAQNSPGADQTAIGYVYNLSKRTALYTTYSHISNRNGGTWSYVGNFSTAGNPGFFGTPAGTGSGNGVDIGMRHTF